jgi:hypothetical protein
MRQLLWIVRNWRKVWQWADHWTRVIDYGMGNQKGLHINIPHHVEFEVPGMVEPYDRMRLVGGMFTSCGKARLGMSLEVYNEDWGGWNGGVIDCVDVRDMRDLMSKHLELIDQLPAKELYRLQQNFSERQRLLKQETMNATSA